MDQNNELDEQLLNYKNELLKIHEKSYEHFEKQLSYISAGALGLSFILIEKVFKDISATQVKGLLIASWVLLGSTLFINLLSHLFTSKKHYKTIDEINNGSYNPSLAVKRNKQISWVNTASVTSLFAGILLFIFFTSYNIINMNNKSKPMPNQPDITRGLPSAPPPPIHIPPVQPPSPGTGVPSSPPPPVKTNQ